MYYLVHALKDGKVQSIFEGQFCATLHADDARASADTRVTSKRTGIAANERFFENELLLLVQITGNEFVHLRRTNREETRSARAASMACLQPDGGGSGAAQSLIGNGESYSRNTSFSVVFFHAQNIKFHYPKHRAILCRTLENCFQRAFV